MCWTRPNGLSDTRRSCCSTPQVRLGDPHAAEEAVQETYLAGLRNRHQFRGRGVERAWLLGILKRKIIDFARRRTRAVARAASPTDSLADGSSIDRSGQPARCNCSDDPSTSSQREEFWQAVDSRLHELPQRQADVFRLREIEGKSTVEICHQLGITAANCWVILHRARSNLAGHLTQFA